MEKIYYIGYFDTPENQLENRNFVLSASNKMAYIASAIRRAGYAVEILSASETRNRKRCPSKEVILQEGIALRLPFSIGWGNIFRRVLSRLIVRLQLLFYLLFQTAKQDQVIVYHSLGYLKTIALAKKIKKFRLILEVEEIYSDVIGDAKTKLKELDYFQFADAFLFPTELLNASVNKSEKPFTIIYGTYRVEKSQDCLFDDGKIHCVYSGIFDIRKGVLTAIHAAEYLDERYHIHIIGFGGEQDTLTVKEVISEVSQTAVCKVTYDGLLRGETYIKFLQSCQIGLSPQNPTAAFTKTSFPSKVFTYLANGLHVVSIRINTLENSLINDLLYYYDCDSPESVADAIRFVDLAVPYDSKKRIGELDLEFVAEMKKMLKL